MSVASELGSSSGVQEPMRQSTSANQEGIDNKLSKDILQLERTDLAEGAVICQACGSAIREGGRIIVSAFRSASEPKLEIDNTLCRGHEDEYHCSWEWSLRELVVRGRVGTVSDTVTQSAWPVLLDPELIVFSPLNTVEAYTPDSTDPDFDTDGKDARVDVARSIGEDESSEREKPSSWCDSGGSQ